MGKGEIARYEQFLLFPQCFQKTCTSDTKKPGLVWERVNQIFLNFNNPDREDFPKHIGGVGENAGNHYFQMVTQYFLSFQRQIS